MARFPIPSEEEHLALDVADDPDSDAAEIAEVEAAVDAFIVRALEVLRIALLDAIERALDDGLEPPPGIDATAVRTWTARVREETETDATGLAGLGFARQLVSTYVGAEPGGPVEHRLTVTATPTIDRPAYVGLSTVIDDWLRTAYPDVQRQGPSPLPRALRRFRLAAVWPADPPTVAAGMAAEHPALLPVATRLVERHAEVDAALDAFDQGLARAVGQSPDPGVPTGASNPADEVPGPKRSFTRYHLGFAVIIALLTIWHYVLR